MTREPAPAAPRAAPRPAGPPPTTRTSVSATRVALRGGSVISRGFGGCAKGGIALYLNSFRRSSFLVFDPLGEQVHRNGMRLSGPLLQQREGATDLALQPVPQVPHRPRSPYRSFPIKA